MNLLSSFVFFRHCLFSKRANAVIKKVSLICFLGLTVSMASLLIVFNVMGGLGQAIKAQFLKTEPHITVFLNTKPLQDQKEKIISLLKSSNLMGGLEGLDFFESGDVVVQTRRGAFAGAQARSLSQAGWSRFLSRINLPPSLNGDIVDESHKQHLKAQKKPEKHIKKKAEKEIVINWELARQLDLYEGERVALLPAENLLLTPTEQTPGEWAHIKAIVSLQNTGFSHVFYDRKDFPSFVEKSSHHFGLELRIKDPEDFMPYKKVLTGAGFLVETWTEKNSSLFFALRMEKTIMSVFLSIAGFITLLALSSLLVLLMVQKKRERGALMAMGLSTSQVGALFLKAGLLMAGMGMLGAFLLSSFVCLFLKYVPLPFLSSFYEGGALFPVEFHFSFMGGLFLSVLGLSFLVCVWSVRSQSFFSPSELLKTETN